MLRSEKQKISNKQLENVNELKENRKKNDCLKKCITLKQKYNFEKKYMIKASLQYTRPIRELN